MADYQSQVIQDAIASANQTAQSAYQSGMLELGNQQLAFQKAQQAWKEVMDRAGLTGMYEGQFTMPVQQWQAETFGTWGAPQQGQQTQSAQQQAWNQAYQNSMAYGQYFAPGQAGPAAGQQTLAAQNQANQLGLSQGGLTGWYVDPTGQRQQTLAGQQQGWSQGFQEQQEANRQAQLQQQNTQQYLQLLSQLRGPADWAKYQQVLGATPGGMRDLYAAAMGQYIPGGGATTGYQPQAVSLNTMQQQIAGQPVAGTLQATAPNWQQQAGANQTMQALQGGLNPAMGQEAQQRQQYAQQAYMQQAAGGGTNMMGATQPQQGQPAMGQAPQGQPNMPAPNQIAPQAWKNLAPSQREMMLGDYEAQGWHKPDVEALFNQSLPKYAANAPSAGTFRLR